MEHLEGKPGKWIKLEYRHIASLAGPRFVLTNAGEYCGELRGVVAPGKCVEESVEELLKRGLLEPERVIVLDPRADVLLDPGEAAGAEAIVIGGILGDHPPRGRTWEMLTSRLTVLGVKPRSLGEGQYSIDGAAYMALQVASGRRLEDILTIDSPTIEVEIEGLVWEVTLPFRYPLVGGKPLLAPGLEELLRGGLGLEEARLLRG